MNKIEEGCTAIVIHSYFKENIGKVVTVGRFLGNEVKSVCGNYLLELEDFNDLWEINQQMKVETTRKEIVYILAQREENLQRIDDSEIDINESIELEETMKG